MTTANFVKALRAFCSRSPFQSFLVELVSGDVFIVVHPEALSLRGDTAIFTGPNGRYKLFDSTSVCQLCDLEETPPRSAAG